jgi:hypothetical protein
LSPAIGTDIGLGGIIPITQAMQVIFRSRRDSAGWGARSSQWEARAWGAALADPDGGQRWVIYDEAWRLLRQASLLARMQSQWKLSRALGIANLMVIHRLSDLDAVGEANSQARNVALGLLAEGSTIVYA